MKLGSSLLLKLALEDSNGNPIPGAVVTLYLAPWTDGGWGQEIAASSMSNPKDGNTFRYDPESGQYMYNLDTSPLSVGTWEIRIKLDYGTIQTLTMEIV